MDAAAKVQMPIFSQISVATTTGYAVAAILRLLEEKRPYLFS